MIRAMTSMPLPELSAILFAAYLVWVLVIGLGLVLQRRSPAATLGWLFALLAMPYIGVLVWVLFGPRRLRRRRLRYAAIREFVDRATLDIGKTALPESLGDEIRSRYRQLMTLASRLNQPAPARADDVTLYFHGDECYDAIALAIESASHHVHLEYYIWDPGGASDRILLLLIARAQAGVAVKVLVDDLGSGDADDTYFAPLVAAGGQVAWFNPVRFTRLRPTIANFRTHRKIVVCDGVVGFTGGMNLSQKQSALSAGDASWRDTHVRITGAPVAALQRVFLEDWQYAAGTAAITPELFPRRFDSGTGPIVQIIASGPDSTDFAIYRFMFAAITSARSTIRLASAYFIPDDAILEALKAAALRGIHVQVMVPARGDSRLVAAAARSYFDELTRTGIEVHEYGPAMMHAKTLSIDGVLGVVGTANTDNRSFRLNFEVVAAVFDPSVARALEVQFRSDLDRCTRYRPMYDRGRFGPRLAAASARLFSPLL